ncbi:hypothetical protein AHF37_02015 [Paragonimus kellicotti]|nr:hypothetical protein AHF37_02015 [Paragonimus kellicotti]
MNPLTNTKNQNFMNERELRLGYTGTMSSWHRQYKDSAWIYVGGLNYELTEGDVICVFSQYGEIVNVNLVRDKKTGVSKGFAFICYEDQRSTVLATDNLNGIKVAGRIIRVDHVENYKVPKEGTVDVKTEDKVKAKPKSAQESDLVTSFVREHGCGPEVAKRLKEIEQQQEETDKLRLQRLSEKHGKRDRRTRHSRSSRSPHSNRDDCSHRSNDRNRIQKRGNFQNRSPSCSPPRKWRESSTSLPRIKQESPCQSDTAHRIVKHR